MIAFCIKFLESQKSIGFKNTFAFFEIRKVCEYRILDWIIGLLINQKNFFYRVSHRIIFLRNISFKYIWTQNVSANLVNVLTINSNRFGKLQRPLAEGSDQDIMWNFLNLEKRLEKFIQTREWLSCEQFIDISKKK
jgi:hypothetical protein